MARAILVAKKLTEVRSVEAVGRELQRRCHAYTNEVDPTKSYLNEDYVRGKDGRMYPVRHDEAEPEELAAAIDRRIGELHTKRKIRKDAVRAEGFVISTAGALPDNEARAFLHESIDWLQNRYGAANLLAASVHMDESVPHAQVWIAPVIHDDETGYDRLTAKELFSANKMSRDKKKVLQEGTLAVLQREFYEQVAARWGYERPFTHEQRLSNGRAYKSLAQFKADEAARRAEERAESAAKEAEAAEAKRAEAVRAEAEATERLESVRRAADEIESLEKAGIPELARRAADRGAGDREATLAGEVARLRDAVERAEGGVADLEREIGERREQVEAAERRAGELEGRVREARSALARIRGAVAAIAARWRRLGGQIGGRVSEGWARFAGAITGEHWRRVGAADRHREATRQGGVVTPDEARRAAAAVVARDRMMRDGSRAWRR